MTKIDSDYPIKVNLKESMPLPVPGENEYRCDACKGIFEYGWSDEEASLEFEQRFEDADIHDAAIVCDDCYKSIMGD